MQGLTYGDWIVIGVLAVIVGAILVRMIRNRKKSCGSCRGCCGSSQCTGRN